MVFNLHIEHEYMVHEYMVEIAMFNVQRATTPNQSYGSYILHVVS